MAPLIQSIGRLAIVGLSLVPSPQTSWLPVNSVARGNADKVSLRLMPLGDSITDGVGSSDGNGYRKDLFDLLVGTGHVVDMVGSRKSGNMQDNDNEGWSGFLIHEVEAKAKESVPRLLPNVFTVDIGANDCNRDYEIDGAGQRMEDTVEYLWSASPGSTVILSTLTIHPDGAIEPRVEQVNTMFRDLINRKQAENKRIILAEMHGDKGPQPGDLADGLHPNDAGYKKMAAIWLESIQEAEAKGILQDPVPLR